jgi:hypothetical protein
MIPWSRLAMERSGSAISAIFASTSRSPAALSLSARASAFSSRARSFIASRSSAENPSNALPVLLLADRCLAFVAVFLAAAIRPSSRLA